MFRSRFVVGVLVAAAVLMVMPRFAAAALVKTGKAFSGGYVDVFGGGQGFISGWAYDNGKPVVVLLTFVDVNDASNKIVITSPLNTERPDVIDYVTKKTGVAVTGEYGFTISGFTAERAGYFKLESAYFNGTPLTVGQAATPTLDVGFDHQLYVTMTADEMGYDREVAQGSPITIYWSDVNATNASMPEYVITLLTSETNEYVGQIARVSESFSDSEGKTLAWDGKTVVGPDGTAVTVMPGSYVITVNKTEVGYNNYAHTEPFTVVVPDVFAVLQRDAQRAIGVISLQYALSLYYADNGRYPDAARLESELVPNYLTALPVAPTPVDGSCTAGQNQIVYAATPFGTDYSISFCLGLNHDDITAGPHTMTPADFAALSGE